MVKYRLLSEIELNGLEKEFIDFLIINGITADQWSAIKLAQADKAHHLIALFSDVIFEGIIRKLLYMEFVEPSGIKIFKCEAEKFC
ncbi:MAG: hypothetical protein IPO92_19040 [Saprospiraceae bacterium]|nr:hypothetical protein [Saprospiraceae bacterium]